VDQNDFRDFDTVLIKRANGKEGWKCTDTNYREMQSRKETGDQNTALPFTSAFLQTIDMNQEHYFEETLKVAQPRQCNDQ
jgi:hypothetical protein